jgi:hypothetical protein
MKRLAILLCLVVVNSSGVKAQGQTKIFGGKHYDQFLGCFDCDSQTPQSIWSQFSDYGTAHSPTSIWNELGKYGSLKSNYSPYNPKAKYPRRLSTGTESSFDS